MYVTVTTTYPHVFPGDVPNDKIIVLEDRDGDGRADRSTVFADGLNIPTGLEWGEGGIYVGQNTELLFLEDTDGDGRSDRRRVVLGGFGNGDTHQTINSFTWSPAGELFFGQGDGCESRVETPWGASNLFQAGFYRFRPRRLQLHPLLDENMGPGNPWGVAFDRWGQMFCVDGAGGVSFLSPGQVPTTHRLGLARIGDPGGYCGIGYLDGQHLPDSMQGHFVTGDFKANRVKRFSLEDAGSGFNLRWEEPILQSRHRNFRPVDVKVGPDGAIYVVDWYNPVTCHQDDAYRDPTRDKAHGRIWRISTDRPSTRPADLSRAPLAEVLDALSSQESWTRYHAKRELTVRDTIRVARAIDDWVRKLDPKLPGYEHQLYEALGACATLEIVHAGLLGRLLEAQDPRARAFASRIVGRWHDRLEDPLSLLARRVVDPHPRVRMEAVIACAAIARPESMPLATRAAAMPMDRSIEYAFKQAVHHLEPHWRPAMEAGQLSFESPGQLARVLSESGGREAVESLKTLLDGGDLDIPTRTTAIETILSVGNPNELQSYGLDPEQFTLSGTYQPGLHATALARLLVAGRERDLRPSGDLADQLSPLLASTHLPLRASALRLTGHWKLDSLAPAVLATARDSRLPIALRRASFEAMAAMRLPAAAEVLTAAAATSQPSGLRAAAIQSLADLDMQAAARQAALLFKDSSLGQQDSITTLQAFLGQRGGAEVLIPALQEASLSAIEAKNLLEALFATGRSDAVLVNLLARAIGPSAAAPVYSPGYVKKLVARADQHGAAERGEVIFKTMACASCHRVSGSGSGIGPDLTALGTTLAPGRIVEELLWPNRQIKEGFALVQVVTDEGKIYQGYERRTRESQQTGNLVIQELSSGKLVTIARDHVEEKLAAGSAMPAGLTAILSPEQLQDLVRYLVDLGKIK
jgi:putative heme-binding domain-containing protein